ncbi:MAG TPA: cell division protein ZapA [Vicinamibacterales bacterium]|jgi:cell division protein ZapA|nr:cell division protein ZapA [Vicinamibacterales bacterium]
MAQVSVTINARQYRMACEDGQENHLTHLANDIDRRIQTMRSQFGEVGDMRLTIMAAIMVADELSEVGGKIRQLEQELESMRDAQRAAAERTQAVEAAYIDVIATAAERIERATQGLNRPFAASRAS